MIIPFTEWVRSSGSDGSEAGCHEHHRPTPLPQHIGLWLDRCLAEAKPGKPDNSPTSNQDETESEWGARDALYATAIEAFDKTFLDTYRTFFKRWKAALTAPDPQIHRRDFTLTTTSRLLLHPAANESVTEGSLLLHHTYGVPYIPGSALKGAVRSRLKRLALACSNGTDSQPLTDIVHQLLGYLDNDRAQASAIDFLDALWIPPEGSSKASPLALDIVNVHHPDYYTKKDSTRQRPTDLDDPTVIHRLTVAPESEFLCIVEARQQEGIEDWLGWLLDEILAKVGEEDGLGAATSVGYGRFSLPKPGAKEAAATPATAATDDLREGEWLAGDGCYRPNIEQLQVSFPNGQKAFAKNEEAKLLLETLSASVRKKLRKGQKIEVQIAPLETSWKITKVR